MELKGRKVTVVGLARSGVSAALLLRERGADVRATDSKPAEDLGDAPARLAGHGVKLFLGGHPDEAVEGAELVVTSPGVPETSRPLAAAKALKIEVLGELELAWRLVPEKTSLIAITGSNGKSTTTTLTGHLLAKAGVSTWVGGNLGTPLSELIRSGQTPQWAVTEVSSFMLENAPTFAPAIAAILNVSANHLDRHASIEEYAAIKARIWKNAGEKNATVFNRDDARVAALAAKAKGRRISFGKGAPETEGSGYDWNPRTASVTVRLDSKPESYSLRDFPAPGAHNAANAAAAILMARLAGVPAKPIEPALASFVSLEHRLEKCGEARGVTFYNDSKATTADALAKSLGVFEKGVVLIAGGKDKGGDFVALRPAFRGRVKKLVTFGTAKDLIADALEGTTNVVRTPDLSTAFHLATTEIAPGSVVLFSPACSSYDQFANFEERGRAFKTLAKGWIEAASIATEEDSGGQA